MRLVVAAVALLCGGLAPAYAEDFQVIFPYVDRTMNPMNLMEVIEDGTRNPIVVATVEAVAVANGAQPGAVTAIAARIPVNAREGELSVMDFQFSDGFRYCYTREISLISHAPRSGDHPAQAWFYVGEDRIGIHTITPRQRLTEGRSWVEMSAVVVGVRRELFEDYVDRGICKRHPTPTALWTVRGSSSSGGPDGP